MEKIYRNLPWIDSIQALDYLKSLTGMKPGVCAFVELCKVFQCNAYIRCCHFDEFKDEGGSTLGFIRLDGYYALMDLEGISLPPPPDTPNHLLTIRTERKQNLYGEISLIDVSDDEKEEFSALYSWEIYPTRSHVVKFIPHDIEVLASKITGQPTLKEMQQQLEQERTARQTLEQQAGQAKAVAKPAHLLAISGLLELLLDDSRPRYTQGSAAEKINELHPDWRGSSASNLTKVFADANAAAVDANKEAQAKAEARQAATATMSAKKTKKT